MITRWKHQELKNFFFDGDISGIKTQHVRRLKIICQRLNAAVKITDMDTPGMNFHQLSGKLTGYYSVRVNKNWRVIFKFEECDAVWVDYLDYH